METVKIQGKTIPVVPQKHARLRHKLGANDFQAIVNGFDDGTYGKEAYRVLSVLIPELPNQIPLYEWEGYASQEAMDNDQYDEDNDPSPTTAEIVDAFEKALIVSGAGRMGKIIDLITAGAAVSS